MGLVTLDEKVAAAFEPGAPPPAERLAQLQRLAAAGIPVQGRLDPILPGITDSPEDLGRLLAALARAGARGVAASTLFLRPAVHHALRKGLADRGLCARLLGHFARPQPLRMCGTSSRVMALPPETRSAVHARVREIARRLGMAVHVCRCKNPDMPAEPCHINGDWSGMEGSGQMELFPDKKA